MVCFFFNLFIYDTCTIILSLNPAQGIQNFLFYFHPMKSDFLFLTKPYQKCAQSNFFFIISLYHFGVYDLLYKLFCIHRLKHSRNGIELVYLTEIKAVLFKLDFSAVVFLFLEYNLLLCHIFFKLFFISFILVNIKKNRIQEDTKYQLPLHLNFSRLHVTGK